MAQFLLEQPYLAVGGHNLVPSGKYRYGSMLTAFPASFMPMISLTYLLAAQECFRLKRFHMPREPELPLFF